jgi:hypothetical protein
VARWASGHWTVPVDLKIRLGKAFPGPGLPTGIIRHRTDDSHLIISLAVQQHWRRGIALVDEVLGGESVARGERGMHDREHVIVRGCCRRRLDVHDQVRRGRVAGLGEVDFVAHPFHAALGAIARFRVVG